MLLGDIFIRSLEMPAKTRGVVVEIEDDFIVFINSVLSPRVQQNAVHHEIKHITEDHFYNEEPVVHDERAASGN